ncbi:hypothetical protein D2Q93_01155 [Alicyclobacillaceae bacterium I2511]|nr:hypothetical protein D2Q93_01155 [Alicyclobacillaceae bacterium I2511]
MSTFARGPVEMGEKLQEQKSANRGWLIDGSLALRLLLGAGVLLGLLLVGLGISTQTVFAATNPLHTETTQPTPTVIPQGKVIDHVVVVGHNAIVNGQVTDTVLVIDGDLLLGAHSNTDLVIDLGGSIRTEPGAQTHAVYAVSMTSQFRNSLLVGGVLLLILWGAWVAFSVVLVTLPIGGVFIFRPWLEVPLGQLRQSVHRSGWIGLLLSLVFLAIMTLLSVTLVALPVAVVFAVLYLVFGIMGWTAVSLWMGKLILRHRPQAQSQSRWQEALIGAAVAMMLTNIPVVGWLLFIMLWCIGVGAVTQWLMRLNQRPASHPM